MMIVPIVPMQHVAHTIESCNVHRKIDKEKEDAHVFVCGWWELGMEESFHKGYFVFPPSTWDYSSGVPLLRCIEAASEDGTGVRKAAPRSRLES